MVPWRLQRAADRYLPVLLVCLYGWSYAVYFGFVVLDSVYARRLNAAAEAGQAAGNFSEISDFLVMPCGLLVLAGAAACVAASKGRRALNPIMISWFLLIALLVLQPLAKSVLDGTVYGPIVRLLRVGLGSVFALTGITRFERSCLEPRQA